MRMLSPRRALPEMLVALRLPPPRTEAEAMRLLDRWEADLCALIAFFALVVAAVVVIGAEAAATIVPSIGPAVRVPLFLIVELGAFAAFTSALSAVNLGSRSHLKSPSPFFVAGATLGLAAGPLGFIFAGAALVASAMP
jgi:hypothetical protein